MTAADREALKRELKELIIHECQKEMTPDQIADDAPLFGASGPDLDSLDALQIAMAVQRRYGKRIEGNTETRSALASINALADFIRS
ncbi:MAG: phosphopantetheine-binding protein [Gemmatimonadaceae bacterium]